MESTAASLWDTLTKQLSPDVSWAPIGGALLSAALGLVFMVKGARLAPVLAALVFAGLGAATGTVLAFALNLPFWPTAVVAGTIGLVLGIVLFRLWFALLVAGCMIAGGVSLYTGHSLVPALKDYPARGLTATDLGGAVTLPEPQTLEPGGMSWQREFADLWAHLDRHVPNFRTNLTTVIIVTGLSGLIFGLLLPRAARAFWAATTGTLLFVPAALAVLHTAHSQAAAWLSRWLTLLAAVLWSMSFVYNLADVLEWRPKKRAAARTAPAA